ncbi:MAG TPA: DNA-3-methyladenine glycosylase I [Cellulomonas sp.]
MNGPDPDRTLLARFPDGLTRCAWAAGPHDDAQQYHDHEWGIESHDPRHIFETLTLCGFAAGIRWANVYRKREGFRRAFRDYRLDDVAAMTDADVDALMQDTSIIRNRRKIEATIGNARAALALDRPLHELVWDHAPHEHRAPRGAADFVSSSAEAAALARALKSAGFVWVGPSSVYAFMQTVGIVNDHVAGCFRAGTVQPRRTTGVHAVLGSGSAVDNGAPDPLSSTRVSCRTRSSCAS